MATFVMGDIHGAYKALLQCFDRSGFNYETDTLIQLGDITDRHPQVYECVEKLLQVKKLVALKGNHDDWFMQYINTGFHAGSWGQGGRETLLSYLQYSKGRERGFLNPGDVPESHARFFNRQQHYYISRDNDCFLHAGFDRHKDFYTQDAMIYYWDRNLWQDALSVAAAAKNGTAPDGPFMKTAFRNIYIGHTPTTKLGSDKPVQALNIINLDTGAGQGGRLTIMDTETGEYWQSDPVAQLYR